MRKYILVLHATFFLGYLSIAFSQGILNDNSTIYLSGGATIYIDGSLGNFKNQNNGWLTFGATDSIKLTGNWINNSVNEVLTSNNGVVEFLGSNQFIDGTNSTSFNSVVLSGSGVKTLNRNTIIGGGYTTAQGILDIQDQVLDLNSYTLTMTNEISGTPLSGAIRYSTGYIISEDDAAVNNSIVLWKMGGAGNTGNHIIPFGVAGGVQIPLMFNITSTTDSDVSFSTRRTISTCGVNPAGSCNTPWTAGVTHMTDVSTGADISVESVIDRWYQIDPSAAVTGDITLFYQGVENTTSNPTDIFKIQRWINPQWEAPIGSGATGVSSGTGSASASGVSTFGTFVISRFANPLPVEFISFDAECLENAIKFSWATASETKNDFFTLEKSSDGITFTEIGITDGSGTKSNTSYYQSIIEGINRQTPFFRLSQTDTDGRIAILKIIRKSCNKSSALELSIYPNPNPGSDFNILLSGLEVQESITYSLYDAIGKIIIDESKLISDLSGQVSTKLLFKEALAAGVYSFVVRSSSEAVGIRVIVR